MTAALPIGVSGYSAFLPSFAEFVIHSDCAVTPANPHLENEVTNMVEERMSRSQVAINVKKLLRKNPNLRDDDTALVLAYWREFNGARIEITSTKPLTNFCSIIRRRQEIQESGKFLPTKEKVRRKRGKRE